MTVPDVDRVTAIIRLHLELDPDEPAFGVVTHTHHPEVAAVGEILVLSGEHEREIAGLGCKPARWDIHVKCLRDRQKALALAEHVTTSPLPCPFIPSCQR